MSAFVRRLASQLPRQTRPTANSPMLRMYYSSGREGSTIKAQKHATDVDPDAVRLQKFMGVRTWTGLTWTQYQVLTQMTEQEIKLEKIMVNAGGAVVAGCVAAELMNNPALSGWNPVQQGFLITLGAGSGIVAGGLFGSTTPLLFGGLLVAVTARAAHFELVERPEINAKHFEAKAKEDKRLQAKRQVKQDSQEYDSEIAATKVTPPISRMSAKLRTIAADAAARQVATGKTTDEEA